MLKIYIKKTMDLKTLAKTIIISIVILVLSFFMWNRVSNQLEVYDLLQNSDYDYVAIMSNETPKENIYNFYDNEVLFYADRLGNDLSSNINTKSYSLIQDKSYNERSPFYEGNIIDGDKTNLEGSEIRITSNISKYYNLYVGDVIYSRINNKVETFYIKSIYQENYGFYNIDVNLKQGGILMSSEIEIESVSLEKYIYFPNMEIDNHYFYDEGYAKSVETDKIYVEVSLLLLVVSLVFIVAIVVPQLFLDKNYVIELSYYERMGINNKEKLNIILIKNFLVYIIPLIIASVLTINGIFNVVFIISIFIIMIFNIFKYWRKYV